VTARKREVKRSTQLSAAKLVIDLGVKARHVYRSRLRRVRRMPRVVSLLLFALPLPLSGPSVKAQTTCSPLLPCSEVLVDLPYELNFHADHGKILDAHGVGTGFTYIDQPTNGTGYIPQNLTVDTAPPQKASSSRRTTRKTTPCPSASMHLTRSPSSRRGCSTPRRQREPRAGPALVRKQ
jgi:hypothetical protein